MPWETVSAVFVFAIFSDSFFHPRHREREREREREMASTQVGQRSHQEEMREEEQTERERQLVGEHFLVNMDRWMDKLEHDQTIRTKAVNLAEPDIALLLKANLTHQPESQHTDQVHQTPN